MNKKRILIFTVIHLAFALWSLKLSLGIDEYTPYEDLSFTEKIISIITMILFSPLDWFNTFQFSRYVPALFVLNSVLWGVVIAFVYAKIKQKKE